MPCDLALINATFRDSKSLCNGLYAKRNRASRRIGDFSVVTKLQTWPTGPVSNLKPNPFATLVAVGFLFPQCRLSRCLFEKDP